MFKHHTVLLKRLNVAFFAAALLLTGSVVHAATVTFTVDDAGYYPASNITPSTAMTFWGGATPNAAISGVTMTITISNPSGVQVTSKTFSNLSFSAWQSVYQNYDWTLPANAVGGTYTETVKVSKGTTVYGTKSNTFTVTGSTPADTAPPSVPGGLVATAVSTSQINLSWTASTDNVGVTGYKIYRNGTQVGTINTTSFSNTGLTANTAYSFTVAAYDAAGNTSAPSAAASATTQSATPLPTVSVTANPTSITSGQSSTVTWSSTNATSCTFTNFTGTGTSGSTVVSPTVTTTYSATCTGAGGSASSGATVTVSAGTSDTQTPTVPVGLTAVAVSSSQINLSWTASTDNVGVTGYKIYRNGTQVGTSNTVSYSDTGVSSNTSYSYSVAAYDAAGNTSAQSATASATTQTATGSTVFNCTGFAASGPCGVTFIWGDANNWLVTGATNGSTPALKGAQVNLIPGGAVHNANNLDYQVSKVNVQAFTTTFTFVPNGWNIALILNNSTNNPWGGNGQVFTSGAGCEGSFFQGFTQSQPAPPNNVFALELDQFSSLVGGGSNFTYSSAQIYAPGIQPQGNVAPGQSPCNPDLAGGGIATNYKYVGVDKISTSPVSLNAPASTINTTTRHTYSATITYDGSNLTLSLYDVTAGGSCPGTGCFTHTWSNINIPAIVGGNTAWVGLGGGTNESVPNPLLINSFSYSTGQPAGAQALSSPAAVTNTGTQTTTPTPTPTTAPTTVPTTAPAPTPTPTVVGIAVNSRVHTNTKANVRKSYSTSATRLGTQVAGSLGTVTQGPHLTSGYNWWFVDFDSGVDGWVRGDLLTQ